MSPWGRGIPPPADSCTRLTLGYPSAAAQLLSGVTVQAYLKKKTAWFKNSWMSLLVLFSLVLNFYLLNQNKY